MYGNEAGQMNRAQQLVGGSLGSVGQPRQPEVTGELDRLGMAVERLAKASEHLTSRLEPIRRQTGNKANGEAAPTPIQCSIASAIRDRREAIERYAYQMETAASELEI